MARAILGVKRKKKKIFCVNVNKNIVVKYNKRVKNLIDFAKLQMNCDGNEQSKC